MKQKLAAIEEIKNLGSTVHVLKSDVSNPEGVKQLRKKVDRLQYTINGIIHTAGKKPLDINQYSLDGIKDNFLGKVYGIANLLEIYQDVTFKFVAVTSSLASIIGDVNRFEYCASNSYLDYLAKSNHSNIGRFISINWPGWSDVGMVLNDDDNRETEFSKSNLSTLMEKNYLNQGEGVSLFYELINQSSYTNIAISKLDIKKLKSQLFTSEKNNFGDSKVRIIEEVYTDLEYEIAVIFCEILGLEEISINDDFFKLGGNSIIALKLINSLRSFSRGSVTNADIFISRTPGTIAKLLDVPESTFEPIINFTGEHNINKPSLFMIHPGNSGCEVYYSLSQKLKEQYNCYGLDNYNLHHSNKITSLNKLAGYYLHQIQEIIKIHPQETYYLFGWSLGGQISLEIASILESQGIRNIKIYSLDTILCDNKIKSLRAKIDGVRYRQDYISSRPSYDQSYLESVINNMDNDLNLANQQITNKLKYTNTVLFKAMLKSPEYTGDIMSSLYNHTEKLPYNNFDKIHTDLQQISMINCFEYNHDNIIDNEEKILQQLNNRNS